MNVPVGAAGVRGLGGRGYLAYTGLGRGYQLKGEKRGEDKLYDLLPGMELTPMNHVTLKPQGIKLAPQVCVRKKKEGQHPGQRFSLPKMLLGKRPPAGICTKCILASQKTSKKCKIPQVPSCNNHPPRWRTVSAPPQREDFISSHGCKMKSNHGCHPIKALRVKKFFPQNGFDKQDASLGASQRNKYTPVEKQCTFQNHLWGKRC